MQGLVWMVSLWVDGIGLGQAPPWMLGWHQVERMNRRLHGTLVAHTRRGLRDNRVWSPALGKKRDMLVYLPPGYTRGRHYPLALFLHGAAQDEQFFMQALVEPFDREIAAGRMPPVIVAAPDGSIHGHATLHDLASFWADSRAGNFETYLMRDIWNFMHANYSIRPEREAHAVMGVSMGGSAAVRIGIEYRESIGMAVGIMPLVNLRYVDGRGKYRAHFNPLNEGVREKPRLLEPLGTRKMFTLRFRDLFQPMFGRGDEVIPGMARINPLEVLERSGMKKGELDLYLAYGGRDEFNVAAQVQSFAHRAAQLDIPVTVVCDPAGRHDRITGMRLFPGIAAWASERVRKLAPERAPVPLVGMGEEQPAAPVPGGAEDD
ncbi:MAG: alpha/beta hydrolase [Planctomycetota bacterium]